MKNVEYTAKAIITLGRPGSGKGTLASNLNASHRFVHLCSSVIFENRKKADPVFKSRVAEFAKVKDAGGLLPDEFVWTPISDAILLVPEGVGIVFDGCTRTAEQMRLLLACLNRLKFEVFIVLIDLVSNTCDGRMITRSKEASEETFRPDDVDEVSRARRLWEFEKHFPSIEAYLDKVGKMIYVIDGDQTPQEILGDVENYVGLPVTTSVSV
ncbi:MAG: nucleoside monophosphate kinase [Minisyncoccota bacterium]